MAISISIRGYMDFKTTVPCTIITISVLEKCNVENVLMQSTNYIFYINSFEYFLFKIVLVHLGWAQLSSMGTTVVGLHFPNKAFV